MNKFLIVIITTIYLTGCGMTQKAVKTSQYKHLLKTSNHPQMAKIYHKMPKYEHLSHHRWHDIAYRGVIKPYEHAQEIPHIKERLKVLGDLQGADNSNYYDSVLLSAVIQFQKRHGIEPSGTIGKQTTRMLNLDPHERFQMLAESMRRFSKLPTDDGHHYIQVNIPSYDLKIIRSHQPQLGMRVVVGQPFWRTPILVSKVRSVVVNPSWNVPVSITEREMVPHMIKDPEYLTKQNIRIYHSWMEKDEHIDPASINWHDYLGPKRLPYYLSQLPGEGNALGQVKFIFNNKHNVYMHDTPLKKLFSKDKRSFSHGCIRLERPMDLFDYLIANNSNTELDVAYDHLNIGKTKYLALHDPIPIYITYITAWVDDSGTVQFRDDVYGKYQLG